MQQISRTDCLTEKKKNGADYEETMKEAFNEIFTKLGRSKKTPERRDSEGRDLERRRGSAPATVLRDQLKAFRKLKQPERRLSTPPFNNKDNLVKRSI